MLDDDRKPIAFEGERWQITTDFDFDFRRARLGHLIEMALMRRTNVGDRKSVV